ncbi:MAG: hypothetical protein PHW03_03330 [Eubacteriales bacterium]|nr:hypothetical protein [Eubacteriales bacterium]MDD4389818.1 hypothetical protein [Eubacteriales bacterium]
MVHLLIGHKGVGKTRKMCDMANEMVESAHGSIVFISKNDRLIYNLKHNIRSVHMEDFKHITNCDEYIGFIYGIMSSDHDLETVFIDSILKHADFELEDLPGFITRLKNISKIYGPNFVVSVSADMEELTDVDFTDCEIINLA